MKLVLFAVLILFFFSIRTFTQSPLSSLLPLYFDLKNALVNDDAVSASKKAADLLSAINNLDTKNFSAKDQDAFMTLKSKLSHDARHISEVSKIDLQRGHFARLSLNMFTLAKSGKISGQPVYEDYCPMKKANWLSAEFEIKNPYFGNQMLSCGDVANTLR
jgi:Protein of unknown function (DUF3347)